MSAKLVMSAISEELAVCTICTGIEQTGDNGKTFTLGAMADIDLFGMFTMECEELTKWVTVTDKNGNKRKMPVSGELWTVQQKRGVKQRYEKVGRKLGKRGDDVLSEREQRIAKYAALASAELPLTPDETPDELAAAR